MIQSASALLPTDTPLQPKFPENKGGVSVRDFQFLQKIKGVSVADFKFFEKTRGKLQPISSKNNK